MDKRSEERVLNKEWIAQKLYTQMRKMCLIYLNHYDAGTLKQILRRQESFLERDKDDFFSE